MLNSRYNNNAKSIIPLKENQRKARKKIIDKLTNTNEYSLINRDCVCGSANFEILSEKCAYGLPHRIVICQECGLIQASPCLDKESLDNFYTEFYDDLYEDAGNYEQYYKSMLQSGNRILEYITSVYSTFNPKQSRVLEIGCNAGGILKAFALAGCTVFGVDLNQNAIDFAISKGIPAKMGSANDIDPSDKFDVIILSHVMEHFLDIRLELSNISNLLKDDGILYIEVPGIYSSIGNIQFDFLNFIIFDHLYYFSLNTLINAMRINGFEFVAGDELPGLSIRSIFKKKNILDAENTAIKNYYHETLDRLNYLEHQFQRQKLKHYAFRILKTMPKSLKFLIKSIIKTR